MSVTLTIEEHVARITINRPQALNAIDETSERALQEIWARLEGESASCRCPSNGCGRWSYAFRVASARECTHVIFFVEMRR